MSKEINERVKELRLIMQKSQVEFCELLGIKQGTLSDIERKRINVSPKTIDKIIQILKVSNEWLYTGNGYIFIENNDNVMYGTDVLPNVRIKEISLSQAAISRDARIKISSFWKLLLEKDSKMNKTWDELNRLEQNNWDLIDYLKRMNSVIIDIENEVAETDYKVVMSKIFIEKNLHKLSFLKNNYDNLSALNSSIESVLLFIDHTATS